MNDGLEKLFNDLTKLKVAVIGDVMLDTYWWGEVERISPEAPVPVVAVSKKELRVGGAGNVALNAQHLGAEVSLITVVGADDDGVELKKLIQQKNIDTSFILESKKRITTNKIRIISRNQHMMRLDAEQTNDLDENDAERLIDTIKKYVDTKKPDVIILEDYNKGILTAHTIKEIISYCNEKEIIVTVDPKRKNFFEYKNVTLFKPNLHEVFTSLNIIPGEIAENQLHKIHAKLHERLNHTVSLITLSEKGVFYKKEDDGKLIPSHLRNIADVSGAGDTVIAVASLVYAANRDMHLAASIANIAGGIVCEEVGTVAIDSTKLFTECKRLLSSR
ncbi:MAG: bifunctional ADP-heptose synthase [Ginsengibacter sp.]